MNSNDLANLKNVWWVIADCSDQPHCGPGSKLLEPFNFPKLVGTAPYYLVFDECAKVIQSLTTAIENGLMSLEEFREK